MDTLHHIAIVFFILFIVTAVVGQVIAWAERSFDNELYIIEEALGHRSNAYLFIASLFFIIAIVVEMIALVICLVQLAGWL